MHQDHVAGLDRSHQLHGDPFPVASGILTERVVVVDVEHPRRDTNVGANAAVIMIQAAGAGQR